MKRQMVCFFLLISFFSYYPSHGQYEKEAFHLYTPKDGLSNRFISGLVQDSLGYIWISTFRGLNRFDGSSFKQFLQSGESNAIPDNTITSSKILSGNELAIATNDGAQIVSTKTLGTKNLNVVTQDALRYWSNCTKYVQKDADGNYGVSTNTGFYIFSPEGKLKNRFDYYGVKDIGHSWMLFGRQVYKLPNGDLLQENSADFLEYDRKKNRIGKLSDDYPGLKQILPFIISTRSRIFFLSQYDLLVLNKEKQRFVIVDIRNGDSVSYRPPFDMDEEIGWQTKATHMYGDTWAMTSRSKGFYILHIDTIARRISFDPKKYFDDLFCNVILSDNQNRLWIGTNEGLYMQKLNRKTISSVPLSYEKELRITNLLIVGDKALMTDDQDIFVADKYSGKILKRISLRPSSSFFSIASLLLFHPDTVWIGTNYGLMWLNTKNYDHGKIAITGIGEKERIHQMFKDSKMNVWLASTEINKVVEYNSTTHQFTLITDSLNPALKVNMANSFAEDAKGNIWIGGDAIARWNCKLHKIDTLIERLASQQNRKKGYSVMNDTKRNVWVEVNDDGIAKITGEDAPVHVRSENLSPDYSSWVYPSMLNDKVFTLTNHNIGCFNTRDLESSVFNYWDGVPDQLITSKYFAYDSSDHSTWFACDNIICRIPDVGDKEYAKPPILNVAEVSVNDSLINFPSPALTLEHRENDVRIFLNAINFTDPGNMRFAYRLKSKKDTNWIDMGTQQNILLSNLSPGKYNVEIRLRDFDNRWPEQFKYFQLTIQPPFWKSVWFIIVTSLLLLFGIYVLFKWRISRIRRTEREKLQVQELKTADYRNRLELEQISNYFSSSLAGKNNIDEVLWDVAKSLIGRMGYVDCMIYLWNEDKTKMIQKAGLGPKGSPEAIASQIFDVVPGQGVVGYVMETLQPVLIPDTRKDSRYRMDEMFRLSEICVPIIHNGELVGIIDSEHHELNYFKERDLKILTTIATLVGDKVMQIESEKSLEIKEEELTLINDQLAAAQLAALQTQMNPHFIFNALNSIKRMILDNEKQNASRYLSKFAQMIRLTLNHSKETFITLQQNIEYLHAYLEMEQLRFDDSFAFHIETNSNLDEEDTLVPSLMIQPLVENAIWHGLMHQAGDKHIAIRFHQNQDNIICSIEDNGIGINESERLKAFNKQPHRSVGLDNLRNRIKIINEKFDMNCTLDIVDRSEKDNRQQGTLAVLKFKNIQPVNYSYESYYRG